MDMAFHRTGGLQRSRGSARVVLTSQGDGRARLARLDQRGSARAIILNAPGSPEVVFLNTSGGLTGGDRLRLGVEVPAGCRATATTQTAERAYRSDAGCARVAVRHRVGPGGRLDWLPQETILFDGAALDRHTVIDIAGDATCLALEALVLGRAAMGETLHRAWARDVRSIRRDGHMLHLEPLLLDSSALSAGSAVLDGARAVASLVMVGPNAADAVGSVRDVLGEDGVTGGASGFDGRLVVRLMARDGWPLRRQVLRLLAVLRTSPLPRVWQN